MLTKYPYMYENLLEYRYYQISGVNSPLFSPER